MWALPLKNKYSKTITNEFSNILTTSKRKPLKIESDRGTEFRLKYAEQKIFCICIDVYKVYEDDDYDKIYEVLSTFKNKKLKINNTLMDKYKNMLENPDFEQDFWSRTAEGIYKIGHDSIRLMKWLIYPDRCYYDIMNYFDLMGSICKYLNEISKR